MINNHLAITGRENEGQALASLKPRLEIIDASVLPREGAEVLQVGGRATAVGGDIGMLGQ